MGVAIERAIEAYRCGNFPVGAALVVNGMCIGSEANSNTSDWRWSSHAEHKLICKHSAYLTRVIQAEGAAVQLYTTYEPCMMCFGSAIFNRIGRIVYALSDPTAGITGLAPAVLGEWYAQRWPVVEVGLLRSESAALIQQYKRTYPKANAHLPP